MGYTTQRYFDDVKVGDELTPVTKGPMSPAHIMRWSASTENWHRIHYDYPFTTGHDKNPGLLINGSWKQHVLAQMLDEWAGLEGWVAKIGFQYRAMNIEWETLTAWGRVTRVYEKDGLGVVECETGIRNDKGLESTPGSAVVILPKRGGKAVPYPYPSIGG
jgi:acyl dehydratase